MGYGKLTGEVEKVLRGKWKKPRHEVPLGKGMERQCFSSITGCQTDRLMDPENILTDILANEEYEEY